VLELEDQLEQHQQLALYKDKELKNVRKHAKILLKQRNEVEQFFLESLEQVKSEIRSQRQIEYKRAVAEHRNTIGRLVGKTSSSSSSSSNHPAKGGRPTSSVRHNNNSPSSSFPDIVNGESMPAPPKKPSANVGLSDVSPEDRERVLRILFAKINNVSAASNQHLPKHSFDIDIDGVSAASSRQQTPMLTDHNAHLHSDDNTFLTNMDTHLDSDRGSILARDDMQSQYDDNIDGKGFRGIGDDARFAFAS
jgi:hypothetical protein